MCSAAKDADWLRLMEKSERVDLHTRTPHSRHNVSFTSFLVSYLSSADFQLCVRQQNHGQAGSPNRMFQSYSDTQPGQDPGMGTPGMFHSASLEKQMAAMNAANIAKMANRSAPGSAQSPVLAQSSSGYFGGNSLMHQSNGNLTGLNLAIPSPSDQHLQSSISDFSAHSAQQQGGGPAGMQNFQQNMNVQQPSNSMSIATPTSAGPQGAFPDPNNRRSTPAPNQQVAQMQLMQKRKQFIHTIGTLMIQRGQPLPQALTGVAIPPNFDINASQWKHLEPSQTEVGAIRLAGKDIDLYKFFGIVFQTGGGLKVRISSPRFSCHPCPSARSGRFTSLTWFYGAHDVLGQYRLFNQSSFSLLRFIKWVHGIMLCHCLTFPSTFLLHTLPQPPTFLDIFT